MCINHLESPGNTNWALVKNRMQQKLSHQKYTSRDFKNYAGRALALNIVHYVTVSVSEAAPSNR